jgi:putative ABC transport system permease protein
MLRNYFLIALRRLSRERLYPAINVLGLSIGIGCCLLIYLLLQHERSYDDFQAKADDLYQVSLVNYLPVLNGKLAQPELSAVVPTAMGQTLVAEVPEVLRATTFNTQPVVLRVGEQTWSKQAHFVDSDFLEMFSYSVLAGQASEALAAPNSLVLTQEIAYALFGEADPIGQTVHVRFFAQSHAMQVHAVVSTPPTNSNVRFQILLPVSLRPYYAENYPAWENRNTYTLVELLPGRSAKQTQAAMASFYQAHWGENDAEERASLRLPDSTRLGGIRLTPLTDLHLRPGLGWYGATDPQYHGILGAIALLILLIATINYISLGMAQSGKRLREVGVRKVLGAYSQQVVMQFLGEAVLLTLLAMMLAVAWVELALPFSGKLLGLAIEISLLDQAEGLLALPAICLVVGVMAGGYPAWFMARFSPASVLKGQQQLKVRTTFTQVLVVLQFGLTIFLIVCSLLMNRQMQYLSHKDLGFNHDQVVAVPIGGGWSDQGERLYLQLQGALLSHPDIRSLSATSLGFAHGWSRYSTSYEGKMLYAYTFRVDPHYLEALEIQLVEGRNFRPDQLTDSSQVLINEAMAKQLGIEHPVGKRIPILSESRKQEIIGVVKDYHIFSLDKPIEPVVLHMDSSLDKLQDFYLKISPQRQAETVAAIQAAYEQFQPEFPFSYRYLDEDLAQQYAEHEQRTRLMQAATGIALLIACMGLFALASLSAANRTKEIGIRKVFGADLWRLLLLLNRDIVLLALLAFLIGAPLAAWWMEGWLQQFLYRIEIDAGLFLLALLITEGLALTTVSYQVLKVALTAPMEALRTE